MPDNFLSPFLLHAGPLVKGSRAFAWVPYLFTGTQTCFSMGARRSVEWLTTAGGEVTDQHTGILGVTTMKSERNPFKRLRLFFKEHEWFTTDVLKPL